MTGAPTDLVLLRHGETAWNRERRIQGQLDVPLNDEGLRQAEAAARRLAAQAAHYRLVPAPGCPAPALVSSDLQRCRQTAEPIARALGLEPAWDARLRERGYGPFETRTYAEVQRDSAEAFARWLSRDPDFALEGAETLRG
ncbi:MAG TPA: histidine phosphatase family protein, partial [Burkholderiaceae bacterium]|nr:histidine phosphatase family protein [Burkholderiaceae bacterium]